MPLQEEGVILTPSPLLYRYLVSQQSLCMLAPAHMPRSFPLLLLLALSYLGRVEACHKSPASSHGLDSSLVPETQLRLLFFYTRLHCPRLYISLSPVSTSHLLHLLVLFFFHLVSSCSSSTPPPPLQLHFGLHKSATRRQPLRHCITLQHVYPNLRR